MVKKIFSILLRIVISVALLAFLFRQVDTKSLFGIIKNADILYLFIALFLFLVMYVLAIFRWNMLLKGADIKLPFKRVIISFSGGIFFNLFMPSTIGGDMVRSIDLATHTKKPHEVVATVFLDRLSGYIGLSIIALFAVCFGWKFIEDKSTLLALSAITLLLIVALLILFNKALYLKINNFLDSSSSSAPKTGRPFLTRIKDIIRNLHHEIHVFRNKKSIIVKNLLLSFIIQAISPVIFYITALSIGVKINIIYFFVFIPIIGAITLLPISIGGLGLRDATTIFFFAKAGVSKDLAFAMSLLNFVFILILAALGGIIYVFTLRHRRIQHHKSPSVSAP